MHGMRSEWKRNFIRLNKVVSIVIQIKGELVKYFNALVPPLLKLDKAIDFCQVNFYHNQHDFHDSGIAQTIPNLINSARRKLLEQSSNLAAAPVSVGHPKTIISLPTSLSSGAFPAVSNTKQQNLSPATPPTANSLPITPNQEQSSTGKQEHSTKGVPKLNRPELEIACEDFSNIVDNFNDYTIYKGALSSGVEIAVVSTIVTSSKEW